MQIIPAIIPKSQSELAEKVSAVLGVATHVQVDVCDGKFVASKTKFNQLPFLDQIEYELDLMINRPEDFITDYIELQPARIVIHIESVKDVQKLFLALERVRGIIEIGISLSNDTPNDVIEDYLEDVDFIQLMGIATIGSQGQPFDERVLEKVIYFKNTYPHIPISVDGAVNNQTIEKLRNAGVMRFVCGSAVFNGNPVENIEKLKILLQ